MTLDLQRLIKLLNLTRSDNDHEALAAIRMANKMVMAWADVVQQPMKGFDRIAQPQPTSDTKQHRQDFWKANNQNPYANDNDLRRGQSRMADLAMVDFCLQHCDIGFVAFLESLKGTLQQHGRELTQAQREALRKIHAGLEWRKA